MFRIIPDMMKYCETQYDIMGKYPKERLNRIGYTYLHGDAQDTAEEFGGWDIFHFLDVVPTVTGEFDCIVEYPFGEVEGTIFLWYGEFPGKYNGLVVLNSDKESYEYAKKKYEKKSYVI